MFRSLHMKLVLIMLLLITSLMAVVGAFLMTSVTNFYIDDFYSQMGETFGESNADFVNSLRAEAAQEGGVAVMQSMLETYSGTLGIDSRSRNYYILDAASGECLAASDELGGEKIDIVKYSDDPVAFITEALSPAKVLSVEIESEDPKVCRVTVPDGQLSLAIGNKGQNVRLAARLTGWKIDIHPESGFYGEETAEAAE